MSKHKSSRNRLSKQNYCTHCDYRIKEDKTYCTFPERFGLEKEPIDAVMRECEFLKPFDRYKMENTEQ